MAALGCKETQGTEHMNDKSLVFGTGLFGLVLACIFAWGTHIWWLISSALAGAATASHVVLGILGLVFPPFGIVHGVMIWFGWAL